MTSCACHLARFPVPFDNAKVGSVHLDIHICIYLRRFRFRPTHSHFELWPCTLAYLIPPNDSPFYGSVRRKYANIISNTEKKFLMLFMKSINCDKFNYTIYAALVLPLQTLRNVLFLFLFFFTEKNLTAALK